MTPEDYEKQKKDLHQKHKQELFELAREYARANNPHRAGDIVEDHIGKVKIESVRSVSVNGFHGLPTMTFKGQVLNKDGTPTKRKEKYRVVYQPNIINQKER